MSTQRKKVYCCSYLYLEKDGKVLMARRCNTGFMNGYYGLVSGHVEELESFSQAFAREVAEEIGITVEEKDIRPVHIAQRRSPDREYIDIYFTATQWKGEIQNKEPEKCDDISWHPVNSLPENTVEYVRVALENIKDGKFYSEWGFDIQ